MMDTDKVALGFVVRYIVRDCIGKVPVVEVESSANGLFYIIIVSFDGYREQFTVGEENLDGLIDSCFAKDLKISLRKYEASCSKF